MNNELDKRIKEINTENFIYVIFILIIIMAYYANERELDYFLNNNNVAKREYYYTRIIIFLIVSIISGSYFYKVNKEIILLRNKLFFKEKEYVNLDLIASGATLVASLIYLYIAITDKDIKAEISI